MKRFTEEISLRRSVWDLLNRTVKTGAIIESYKSTPLKSLVNEIFLEKFISKLLISEIVLTIISLLLFVTSHLVGALMFKRVLPGFFGPVYKEDVVDGTLFSGIGVLIIVIIMKLVYYMKYRG